jgi:hypothetical protein
MSVILELNAYHPGASAALDIDAAVSLLVQSLRNASTGSNIMANFRQWRLPNVFGWAGLRSTIYDVDALACFQRTRMDMLAIGPFICRNDANNAD